ncbi:MAG TPA: ABC transporter substrate-binding protein [Pseudolabrys sp.]|nr:ABC transporter substrate-binding protein [Pseudolabrys sp.]
MRRREFITLFGGVASLPLIARAQQGFQIHRIGMISASVPLSMWRETTFIREFLGALHDLGHAEGRDLAIEFRSAEGNWERLPHIAAELVGLKVDVLVSSVCGAPLNAAMRATNTIPIVVAACNDDMVETGIIASLAHPGGNVTRLSKMTPELSAKRLELLKEMVPEASRVAILWDPGYSAYLADWRGLQERARSRGVTLQSFEARSMADIDGAFAAIVEAHADAVITFSDTLTFNFANQVAELASRSKLPLMSPFHEIAVAGGLMSYGPSISDLFRRSAVYVDKILRGAKPADLPVEQPTKFELVINLKTAKALGLTVPPSLLARADEVIE